MSKPLLLQLLKNKFDKSGGDINGDTNIIGNLTKNNKPAIIDLGDILTGSLDDINETSFCYADTNTEGKPDSAMNGYVLTQRLGENFELQTFHDSYDGNYIYSRVKHYGNWKSWQQTSPIEKTTNANGIALKYPNGSMVCSRKIHSVINCNSSWGSLYYGEDNSQYLFAENFIDIPEVQVTIRSTSANGCIQCSYNAPIITKNFYQGISIVRPTSASSVAVDIDVLAIGHWK